MRILVYGAGNMGCLYAARLARSGQDVMALARGMRRTRLREQGIVLAPGAGRAGCPTTVPVVDRLAPSDAYDLVLVALPRPALDAVLPVLAANEHTPSVMFFGNNLSGPGAMVSALGGERVLLGFPGAAAVPHDGALRFVITSRREQPTMLGEVDGSTTARLAEIAAAFERAGFPTSTCAEMDAWLKTHAAKILPTVAALAGVGGSVERLAANGAALRQVVRAIREGFAVLRANGVPITPRNHRVLEWVPEALLVPAMRRLFGGAHMAIKVGHAGHARAEFSRLAQDFRALNTVPRLPTPALDRLLGHLAAPTD